MTTFTDGPAAGVQLQLPHAPKFLRVVRDAEGQWDALDQLLDVPNADEEVFVYHRVSVDGTVHVDAVNARGRRVGYWYRSTTYALFPTQSPDAAVRNNIAWRKWCAAQAIYATST